MDDDDYRVEGELADMREADLERRIAELERENSALRGTIRDLSRELASHGITWTGPQGIGPEDK